MPGWAIVIGIDDYRDEELRLYGAVRDAVRFGKWVTFDEGGNVSSANCRFLLGRHADNPGPSGDAVELINDNVPPTKDNIVKAINEVVAAAEVHGQTEQLYFYFSGHGVTAELAGREESALVMPGFSSQHPEHSLALRSLTEHLETTLFKDQFFFIDACRKAWKPQVDIGRWPIPRRRDPGKPPVQQFILYATSPGLPANEVGWPDEAVGAFTEVLMAGLAGEEQAKAWSWDRNCYEVRWERLATYVNRVMRDRRYSAAYSPDLPPGGWPIQIPQDAGSRGVADRDRDARLASYNRGRFSDVELTLELTADPPFDQAEVTVLDAIGTPVVRALRVPRGEVKITLPPRTYAARVVTPDKRVGSVKAPIELYEALTDQIELRRDDGPPPAVPGPGAQALGEIEVRSPDPLSTAEISDESGRMIAVRRRGQVHEANPGFYRVRHLRPERELGDEPAVATATTGEEQKPQEETFVVLSGGDRRQVQLGARAPDPFVVQLAEALGGRAQDDFVIPYDGAEPMAWAQPSTVLAAAISGALTGKASLERLGADVPSPAGLRGVGIALYAVAGNGDPQALSGFSVRMWPTGSGIPAEKKRVMLRPSEHAVAGAASPVDDAVPHWLSIEHDDSPMVLAVPVQPNRVSVVVAQVDPARTRLYQFQPHVDATYGCSAGQLRRLEHLERLLLGGTLDGAALLAQEIATNAAEDPFAGLLAGYVLLRLGLYDDLERLTSEIIEVAPTLSDAFILRGEREAHAGRTDTASQAFADAVNAGIPAFGEGLTRLVEGLRASAFHHPRGALVRHIFRCHVRGSMWAAFAPSRPLHEGQLVISGADIGYEG